MSRWRKKRDANDKPIVAALRDAGAFVEVMSDWDFTVKFPDNETGLWFYLDAKNLDGKGAKRTRAPKLGQSAYRAGALTKRQERLLAHGFPLVCVTSIAEALHAIGAVKPFPIGSDA